MKLVYHYIAVFFNFYTTSNHFHPLQGENCDSNSRLVVDEDDYGKFRLERVKPPHIIENNIRVLVLQDYALNYMFFKKAFSTITIQPQENPARVLLGLHGNSTQGFFLKNLYCLECTVWSVFCILGSMPHKGGLNKATDTICSGYNTVDLTFRLQGRVYRSS